MAFNKFFKKAFAIIYKKVTFYIFQWPRIIKYKIISTCNNVRGHPTIFQPVLMNGMGHIDFGGNVNLGVQVSPYFYSSYIYIDSRTDKSNIKFGDNVYINNNCVFISEGEGIEIGNNVLIGTSCEIYDSDFHDLNPAFRFGGNISMAKVRVGDNVFIGSNVKILKGVEIGRDCVIANGSVVTKSLPPKAIAAGVPAKVIKFL